MNHSVILNGLQIDRITHDSRKNELHLCPIGQIDQRVAHRQSISGRPECRVCNPSPLTPASMVQIKLESDDSRDGFTSGLTMQDSPSVDRLQMIGEESAAGYITTNFEDKQHQLLIEQHLEATPVEGTLRSWTAITNQGKAPVTLDMLSSFVISGITPFADDDAPGRLKIHRFRTSWSNEARLCSETAEALHLERSWAGFNLVSQRFGQVGTMPVRKFFPFIAVEDTEASVLWGAQLAWAGSWQIEITRRADQLSISGGLADYEFGHWKKILLPGEKLKTPVAHLACVKGDLSNLTGKLVRLQESLLTKLPPSEETLPVIFNEWCTNWGSPSHDKTIALAKRLLGSGVRYIVIDDGWAVRPPEAKMQSNGDWIVDTEKFPLGIGATCDELRKMGFIPGIWFEFEVCNPGSKAFEQTSHHLQRNGQSLRVGNRRFWNLNDPWVQDYLDEKLIGFLKGNGIGYLKVDYNDTIGIGCDNLESIGEGQRQQVNGIHATFERIRQSVRNLVIENCSSGGHRLEPSMMQLTSMSSFSDAHESNNIPIIARQLQYLIPPRQSQIWAVLRPEDDDQRFIYSLTATLYGRMCLSGPIHDLSDAQMELLRQSVAFYQQAAPILKSGHTQFIGTMPDCWNHPQGWQGIWREDDSGEHALLVIHVFENATEEALVINIPESHCLKLTASLVDDNHGEIKLNGKQLIIPHGPNYRGYAFIFEK